MNTFNKGDRIKTKYYGEGYFVCYQEDSSSCIIERDDDEGWPKKNNSGLIPKDYIPVKHESYWSIGEGELELVQPIIVYEIY